MFSLVTSFCFGINSNSLPCLQVRWLSGHTCYLSSISCHSLHSTSDVATLDCFSLLRMYFQIFPLVFVHAVFFHPKCTAYITWTALPKLQIPVLSLLTALLRDHWHTINSTYSKYTIRKVSRCLYTHESIVTLKMSITGASITGPSENCGSEELGLYKFMWS